MGPMSYSSVNWSRSDVTRLPQQNHMTSEAAQEVNIKTSMANTESRDVCVYGFAPWLLCSGSSRMCQQMMRRRRAKSLNSETGHTAVQTEVGVQTIKSVSNLEPHMKVAQIRFDKIRSHVIFAVHTVEKKIR